jgi:hypothetical protein
MTAVEWLLEQLKDVKYNTLEKNGYSIALEKIHKQALDMEREQLIDCGNSCAIKQHIHNERVNKMTMDEMLEFSQEETLTFGEEYYNEIFKKK